MDNDDNYLCVASDDTPQVPDMTQSFGFFESILDLGADKSPEAPDTPSEAPKEDVVGSETVEAPVPEEQKTELRFWPALERPLDPVVASARFIECCKDSIEANTPKPKPQKETGNFFEDKGFSFSFGAPVPEKRPTRQAAVEQVEKPLSAAEAARQRILAAQGKDAPRPASPKIAAAPVEDEPQAEAEPATAEVAPEASPAQELPQAAPAPAPADDTAIEIEATQVEMQDVEDDLDDTVTSEEELTAPTPDTMAEAALEEDATPVASEPETPEFAGLSAPITSPAYDFSDWSGIAASARPTYTYAAALLPEVNVVAPEGEAASTTDDLSPALPADSDRNEPNGVADLEMDAEETAELVFRVEAKEEAMEEAGMVEEETSEPSSIEAELDYADADIEEAVVDLPAETELATPEEEAAPQTAIESAAEAPVVIQPEIQADDDEEFVETPLVTAPVETPRETQEAKPRQIEVTPKTVSVVDVGASSAPAKKKPASAWDVFRDRLGSL